MQGSKSIANKVQNCFHLGNQGGRRQNETKLTGKKTQ